MKSSTFFTPVLENKASPACRLSLPLEQTVKGFGQVTRETRSIGGFTGIDFQANGDVSITLGEVDVVVIEAGDNILPILKTEVIDSRLIISEPANAQISARDRIRFTITMKKLGDLSMSGTGDIDIDGIDADQVKFDLSGTGTITAHGKVKALNASLPGMGFIVCDELEADTVIAQHSGIGEILIRARHSLDAEITGVGAIHYYGDPVIARRVVGYGTIIRLS